MPYRAYDNGQGGVAVEAMRDGYRARPGETLFADPPTEQQLDKAFPSRAKPVEQQRPDVHAALAEIKQRLAELEAMVAAPAAAKDA